MKSTFLNGYINEEVYIEQQLGFENEEHLNHVFKLIKALYGFKQAPCPWYERITTCFFFKKTIRGKVDTIIYKILE